nr:ATPase family AAA domain-containing protein 5-like [Salvelinus alpinus]
MRVTLTPEQRMKSEPVSHCLGSLAEFLDHMSLLDSSLCLHTSPVGGARHAHRTFGLRAETKDGMNDEPREECHGGSWVEGERAGEIQAAVEALSFQRCRAGVEEAWGKAQGLKGKLGKEAVNELTLPVAPHRQGFTEYAT